MWEYWLEEQMWPRVDPLISYIVVVDESFDSTPFFAENTQSQCVKSISGISNEHSLL